MDEVPGARAFDATGEAYDAFVGRYSRRLAEPFADAADVTAGLTALDVGCGPGALTGVLVHRLGVDAVRACDPSPPFADACTERFPGAGSYCVSLDAAARTMLRTELFERCGSPTGAFSLEAVARTVRGTAPG